MEVAGDHESEAKKAKISHSPQPDTNSSLNQKKTKCPSQGKKPGTWNDFVVASSRGQSVEKQSVEKKGETNSSNKVVHTDEKAKNLSFMEISIRQQKKVFDLAKNEKKAGPGRPIQKEEDMKEKSVKRREQRQRQKGEQKKKEQNYHLHTLNFFEKRLKRTKKRVNRPWKMELTSSFESPEEDARTQQRS